jgi:uncharacterized protein YndB with AHSA1/START domain
MPSYDVRVRCAAPKEKVFALVADATTWPKWAGPMFFHGSWAQEGDPPPGGVGAIRKLGSRWLNSREQITEFDPPHYLAYVVLRPSPVRYYRAIVSIDSIDTDGDGDGSRITWAGAWETRIPGTGCFFTWMYRRLVGSMAVGLARYAEQLEGVPHEDAA